MMLLLQIDHPASLPVSLDDAKQHLRVLNNEQDTYIAELVQKAGEYVESAAKRTLVNRSLRLVVESFGSGVELLHPPVVAVTEVKYLDPAGAEITLPETEWRLAQGFVPKLVPAVGKSFPTTAKEQDAVRVTYTAGFGDNAEAVPLQLRQAVLLLVHHWFVNREAVMIGGNMSPQKVPMAVEDIIGHYRIARVR
jgi:uncharacterized phiE125 gp8 family phage protein